MAERTGKTGELREKLFFTLLVIIRGHQVQVLLCVFLDHRKLQRAYGSNIINNLLMKTFLIILACIGAPTVFLLGAFELSENLWYGIALILLSLMGAYNIIRVVQFK